ncbi:MAG TPA: hypothetical protein VN616_12110 [Puia sp.]|nr:hypothetical protein [Puia sp.]
MQTDKDAIESVSPARRRLLARLGVLSFFALVAGAAGLPAGRKRNTASCAPGNKPRMIRMLAEDGTLMEIDASLVQPGGQKASDAEIHGWIKK